MVKHVRCNVSFQNVYVEARHQNCAVPGMTPIAPGAVQSRCHQAQQCGCSHHLKCDTAMLEGLHCDLLAPASTLYTR
eukprot:3870550-Amphidinium_carterae.1